MGRRWVSFRSRKKRKKCLALEILEIPLEIHLALEIPVRLHQLKPDFAANGQSGFMEGAERDGVIVRV